MKKKILVLTLLITISHLVGCTKGFSNTQVSWSAEGIKYEGELINITEYTGSTATLEIPEKGTANFYICVGPSECPHNSLGIVTESMPEFKKNKYYTTYLDSHICMYKETGETYIEGYLKLEDSSKMTVLQSTEILYDALKPLELNEAITEIKLGEKTTLITEGYDWKLRQNEVIIPGGLRVIIDDGSVICDSTETIGDVTLGKKEGTNYDFYQYDGLLFQVQKGINLANMIKFN